MSSAQHHGDGYDELKSLGYKNVLVKTAEIYVAMDVKITVCV